MSSLWEIFHWGIRPLIEIVNGTDGQLVEIYVNPKDFYESGAVPLNNNEFKMWGHKIHLFPSESVERGHAKYEIKRQFNMGSEYYDTGTKISGIVPFDGYLFEGLVLPEG